MQVRLVGKIVLAVLTVVFVLISVIYAISTKEMDKVYHGVRALTAAILALTSATCYRYFED